MGLAAEFRLRGGFQHVLSTLTAAGNFGETSGMPDGRFVVEDGTGANQANQVFLVAFSIATTATQSYDMKGGGGELDVLNRALAMTAVKLVVVEMDTPASGTSVRFGPQNVSNAAQLWFQAVTANFWEEVLDTIVHFDARAGWAIGASTKVVSLHNPGLATVTGKLLVVGTM